MPKIKAFNFVAYSKTTSNKREFTTDIFFNQSSNFYTNIPEEYNGIFSGMGYKDQSEIGVYHSKKSRYSESVNYLITAKTLEEIEKKIKEVYSLIVDCTVTERNVIIVFYNNSPRCQYGNHKDNPEHPQAGLTLALTYALEKSYSGIETPEYFLKGQKFTPAYRDLTKIIDDTPENREFLEKLYFQFSSLHKALNSFFRSSESIQFCIDNKTKFLG